MKLPAPVQAYFDAEKDPHGAAPVDAFATDAIVHDEAKTHVGRAAIATWFRQTKEENQHTAEPLELSEDGALTIVRAEVTGQFPSSPAMLTFKFKLEDDQIKELEITV
ncbi:MAG: nuclear transport factor 2 family protein [Alphaproteobacteria bacterium]|nr:nuclear transport factor 2 family protein [Alphaproteobacteria bacterium]